MNSLFRACGAFAALLLFASPALGQVNQLRDAQGHPYTPLLGIDSGTGLSCAPGPATPTCLIYGLNGSGGSSTVTFKADTGGVAALATSAVTATQVYPATTGATVALINTGAVAECIRSGTGSLTAAVTDLCLPPGIGVFWPVGTDTAVAAITASGSGQLTVVRGTGGSGVFLWQDFTANAGVKGSIAEGTAATDPPVAEGCRAKTALPTAVADGQMINQLCDKYGRRVSPSVLRENKNAPQETDITGTAETTVVTGDAANKLELTCLVLANTNTANPATATVKDSTAGTTRGKFQIPAGDTRGFCVPSDSGWPQAAINSNWTVTLAGTSPTVSVTATTLKVGP